PEEALIAAEKQISLAPNDPVGYGQKCNALLAIELQTLIIRGEEAARAFRNKQLKMLEGNSSYQYRGILRQFNARGNIYSKPAKIMNHSIEHILNEHMFLAQREFAGKGLTSFFPAQFRASEITRQLFAALKSAVSVRELPDGSTIGWWPEQCFVSYLQTDRSEELMRLLIVGDEQGNVVTAFPTFGPGVSYWQGQVLLPADMISLVPESPVIWNRKSRQPIRVLSKWFKEMFNAPELSGLEYIEREQLIWLAVVEGEPVYEDEHYQYYRYKVSFSSWQERLPNTAILIKVSKESFTAVGILGSVPEFEISVPDRQVSLVQEAPVKRTRRTLKDACKVTPALTVKEERDLFFLIIHARMERKSGPRYLELSQKAKQIIIERYLDLTHKVAKDLRINPVDYDEFISEGTLVFYESMDAFVPDPKREMRFKDFAEKNIKDKYISLFAERKGFNETHISIHGSDDPDDNNPGLESKLTSEGIFSKEFWMPFYGQHLAAERLEGNFSDLLDTESWNGLKIWEKNVLQLCAVKFYLEGQIEQAVLLAILYNIRKPKLEYKEVAARFKITQTKLKVSFRGLGRFIRKKDRSTHNLFMERVRGKLSYLPVTRFSGLEAAVIKAIKESLFVSNNPDAFFSFLAALAQTGEAPVRDLKVKTMPENDRYFPEQEARKQISIRRWLDQEEMIIKKISDYLTTYPHLAECLRNGFLDAVALGEVIGELTSKRAGQILGNKDPGESLYKFLAGYYLRNILGRNIRKSECGIVRPLIADAVAGNLPFSQLLDNLDNAFSVKVAKLEESGAPGLRKYSSAPELKHSASPIGIKREHLLDARAWIMLKTREELWHISAQLFTYIELIFDDIISASPHRQPDYLINRLTAIREMFLFLSERIRKTLANDIVLPASLDRAKGIILTLEDMLVSLSSLLKKFPEGTQAKDTEFKGRIDCIVSAINDIECVFKPFICGDEFIQIDANILLEGALELVTHYAEGYSIREKYDPDLPLITVNPADLYLLFIGIIVNAIEAARGGKEPEIAIETRFISPAECIQVIIKDNGSGIDINDLENIFKPFFSTKPGSLGIGISIGKEIAESYGGMIAVHTKAGKGTTVIVTLPVESTAASPLELPQRSLPTGEEEQSVGNLIAEAEQALLKQDYLTAFRISGYLIGERFTIDSKLKFSFEEDRLSNQLFLLSAGVVNGT
ncbi:MAG: ATP-binding protein, partial [Candidatus Omnitrophica bacterium]|nr:ATP-binding protein [Candidatus Omnitrophota bacterium]